MLSGSMPGATWFAGSSLNYAENALRRTGEGTALVFVSEDGGRQELTWDELREEVARYAPGCCGSASGAATGWPPTCPNIPQALIACLATASLGAIWSAGSPDFGVPSIVDRFKQIEPKVLIAVDGYHYNGRSYDRSAAVNEIAAELPLAAGDRVDPVPGGGRGGRARRSRPSPLRGTPARCRTAR
ncbi:hypothetical protein GCM10020220_046310 [Nonomuraea rubra]